MESDSSADPDSQKCCICQGSCQSHFCSSCRKLCHPWCGKINSEDEEGYGCSVTCSKCEDADNLKAFGSGKSINYFAFCNLLITISLIRYQKKCRQLNNLHNCIRNMYYAIVVCLLDY